MVTFHQVDRSSPRPSSGIGYLVAYLSRVRKVTGPFLAPSLSLALPLPFHAGALALWTVLFPDFPQVAAFSLLMHSTFVLLNAAIGLLFLAKVNRELLASEAPPAEPDPRSMRAS